MCADYYKPYRHSVQEKKMPGNAAGKEMVPIRTAGRTNYIGYLKPFMLKCSYWKTHKTAPAFYDNSLKGIRMNIPDSCAKCIFDKQKAVTDDPAFLADVKDLLDHRAESDTSPIMVYKISRLFERHFGRPRSYETVKKQYNDLVLSMEDAVREKIRLSPDPLASAVAYSRMGNYIDFGAMNEVSEESFLALLGRPGLEERDLAAYDSFLSECGRGRSFLLLADNCGEIVFDKILLGELHSRFPQLHFSVMVRGGEVLNDVTEEDAAYVKLEQTADIVSSGAAVAGTVYEMMTPEARRVLDSADVVLSKGQGNYESLCFSGRHIFYSLLCKCELFMNRFQVPKLTGVFAEMREAEQ